MFWLLLLVGALDGIASFSVPILLAEFTKPPISTDILSRVLPIITTCLAVSLFFQWSLRSWGECLTGWLGNDLRLKLFARSERLSVDTLAKYHSGYLASLINQVASSVGAMSSTMVWLLGHMLTTLSLFVYFTARESVTMAVINLAILALFVTISVRLSRRIVPLADDKNITQARVMERFIDLLTNISTVKKLGVIEWANRSLRKESTVSDASIARFQRFHANRWCLLHGIFYTSLLSTIAFLLSQIESGAVSASILVLFIAGFARVQNQAERLSELVKGLLETNAYVGTLEGILAEESPYGAQSVSPLQTISCEGVTHRHSESLYDISVPHFRLNAGDRVLISGKSGQGKSTFLSILSRQRIPTKGALTWNGTPYTSFNESLAHSFALVSQEAELFNLSLRENLSMDSKVSDEEIRSLLVDLGLSDLFATLPEGLDTKVGEKGLRLSAGQKQRITIARGLLLRRAVLLLDEPTSHLDKASEEAVLRVLSHLPPHTTIVIVSHHGELRSLCSREYAFDSGVMREVTFG